MTTSSITLSRDQATRLLHSIQHLHTLHGPCDGPTCPHAAVITELEGMIYLASVPTLDLEQSSWEMIKEAARKSSCMPPDYMMNDWVSDVCGFLTGPQADPTFQAVDTSAMFPVQDASPSGDPHDLADALLRLTTSPPPSTEPYTPTPRLCAACGATLPSTTGEGTNLCGRCSL